MVAMAPCLNEKDTVGLEEEEERSGRGLNGEDTVAKEGNFFPLEFKK